MYPEVCHFGRGQILSSFAGEPRLNVAGYRTSLTTLSYHKPKFDEHSRDDDVVLPFALSMRSCRHYWNWLGPFMRYIY